MQPARPAGHSQLDAKRTSYKQIGKFIKQMHKQKIINVRDVKNTITILSVDRSCSAYTSFELVAGGSHADSRAERASGNAEAAVEDVQLRSKPPVVTDLYQCNNYTKPLFEAMGCNAKSDYFTLDEAYRVLERYCKERLAAPGSAAAATSAGGEVFGWLQYAGLPRDAAARCASALEAGGYDSAKALRAGALSADELQQSYGASEAEAKLIAAAITDGGKGLASWLTASANIPSARSDDYARAFAAAGFDSYPALAAASFEPSELKGSYSVSDADASAITAALANLDVATGASSAAAAKPTIDPKAVPLDDLLIECLIKLAGGIKKGTTYPTHMGIKELRAKMVERMTPFHKVDVEGEAPNIRKGSLKLITIEMKRAAGHNKTHIAGLESFVISPDAVAQALKVKLGCTTAVLKLPGNNVKDMEVLLQGHCVNEVVEYLWNVYSIDKQWIELKLKDAKPK